MVKMKKKNQGISRSWNGKRWDVFCRFRWGDFLMLRRVRLGMGVKGRVVDDVVRGLRSDRRWTYNERAVG